MAAISYWREGLTIGWNRSAFQGRLRARQVEGAIGRGIEAAGLVPPDLCPVADGGEGTMEVLLARLGGETRGAPASDQR